MLLNAVPESERGRAEDTDYRWWDHLLSHRSDPVTAFHHAGVPRGGCWTRYHLWQTDHDGALEEDLVEYFLDRKEQGDHLLGAYGDLVSRESPLRVQCRMAIGERGNRVADFGRQAAFYLAGKPISGSHCYARGAVRLPPSLHDHARAARHFRPSPDLLMALNMALNVGAPLLLTGEPGTGKTQSADFLGWYYDIPVHKYQVKSNALAESLRYDFDAVGYLHWAQTRKDTGDRDPGGRRRRHRPGGCPGSRFRNAPAGSPLA